MRCFCPAWAFAAAIGLIVGLAGCNQSTKEPAKNLEPPAGQEKADSPEKTDKAAPAEKPEPGVPSLDTSEPPAADEKTPVREKPAEQPAPPPAVKKSAAAHVAPPPATIAKVNLPDTLRATCRVQVGDRLPDAELPDLAGKPQPLSGLYGKRATVVCLWNAADLYAVQELDDLAADVAKPFGDKGVQVVGIDIRDTPEVAQNALKVTDVKYPVLTDRDGAYFARVATERLPRTYLVDAEGKILWFDIEYSRTTRRDLLQALQAIAAQP